MCDCPKSKGTKPKGASKSKSAGSAKPTGGAKPAASKPGAAGMIKRSTHRKGAKGGSGPGAGML